MQIFKSLATVFFTSLVLISCSDEDEDNLINLNETNNKLGNAARDLLSDETFTSLTIEIVAVDGFAPTSTAIENFQEFLITHLHKPDGIKITKRIVASSSKASLNLNDIRAFEKTHRTYYNQGDDLTVFIFFTDGVQENDTDLKVTLGTAYQSTSIVVYEKTLKKLSLRANSPLLSTLETATLNHEFGHLLGLVNMGTTTPSEHEDFNSKGHCNSENCLMETHMEFGSGLLDMLGDQVPKLGSRCLADLRANGGK